MYRSISIIFLLFIVINNSNACDINVRKSLDAALLYANKLTIDETSYNEIWYKSLNNFSNKSGLIPDIAIAYAQAGCWSEAINTAKSLKNNQSEYANKRYAYAISNIAILKAYSGDISSANALLNELKYKSQVSSNIYGTLRVAEILTKKGNFNSAMTLIKENRYIDDTDYPHFIDELLSIGDVEKAKKQANNILDMAALPRYLKYLSENNGKIEAYILFDKFNQKSGDNELYFWAYRAMAISYARFDDIDKILEISKKVEKKDEILLLSYSLPNLKSDSAKSRLKSIIFEKFSLLEKKQKLDYINQLALNFSYVDDLDGFIKLLDSITDKPKAEYVIQLSVNTFIGALILKNNISLAEESSKKLLKYIDPQIGRGHYVLQGEIAIIKMNYQAAYDFAIKTENPSLQTKLIVFLSSKNVDFETIKLWSDALPAGRDGKKIIDVYACQAISARLALLNHEFDPSKFFATDDNYAISRSWLGYAQGLMRINPGIEYISSVMNPAESPGSEKLLYQLFKKND